MNSPRRISTSSDKSSSNGSSTTAQSNSSQCVVCMDAPTDIILSPCHHAHCCLQCFRRSTLRTCPLCRSVVTSITIKSSRAQLPFNPPPRSILSPTVNLSGNNPSAVGNSNRNENNINTDTNNSETYIPNYIGTDTFSDSTNFNRTIVRNGVENQYRQSTRINFNPPSFRCYRDYRLANPRTDASRSAGLSNNVSRTATSRTQRSTNSSRRNYRANTAGLNPVTGVSRSGSVIPSDRPDSANPLTIRRTRSSLANISCGLQLFEPDTSPPPRVPPPELPPQPRESIILLGSSRSVIVPLARKLIAAFPPPKNDPVAALIKNSIFIHGDPIRLILIDSTPFSMRAELAARIYRHAPNLVLLCADYTDVASFESVIRLDMEILDYLQFPCLWVLVKVGFISERYRRRNAMNFVDDSDLRVAKHFLGSERHSLIVSVDGQNAFSNVKKLGNFIHSNVKEPDSGQQRNVHRQETPALSNSLIGLWANFSKTRQRGRRRRRPRVSLSQCWSSSLAI